MMRGVRAFYLPDGFDAACAELTFDLKEEVERVIDIIRDEDPRVALGGLNYWRKTLLRDMSVVNGVTATQSMERRRFDEHGNEVVERVTVRGLADRLRAERDRADEDANHRAERHPPGSGRSRSAPTDHDDGADELL